MAQVSTLEQISIPQGLDFNDLRLARESATQRLVFCPQPLVLLCNANDIDADTALTNSVLAHWLIAHWYVMHRLAGGDANDVAEEVLFDVAAANTGNVPIMQPGGGSIH